MSTAIAIALCVASGGLGHLRATVRHRAENERLRVQRNAQRIRADEAERELEFHRMSDPCQIRWGTPQATAGINRLIAEIRSQDLLDRIHDLQRGCDDVVIDLRDREDGA